MVPGKVQIPTLSLEGASYCGSNSHAAALAVKSKTGQHVEEVAVGFTLPLLSHGPKIQSTVTV